LNTFEATLHSGYLYLKVLATFGIITVFGNQKEASNIECGFASRHKNVHFLRVDTEQHEKSSPRPRRRYRQNSKRQLRLKVISREWHSTPGYQTEQSASALK
jgi:hypothetical protein